MELGKVRLARASSLALTTITPVGCSHSTALRGNPAKPPLVWPKDHPSIWRFLQGLPCPWADFTP